VRKGPLLVVATALLFCFAAPAAASSGNPGGVTPSQSTAQPSDPLAAQIQAALQQQQQIDAAKSSLSNEVDAAQSAQQGLKSLITANQATIEQTTAKLAQVEQQYRDASNAESVAQTKADAAKLHETQDKEILAIMVRSGYSSQDATLAYLLSGSSFTDLIHRADTLQRLVKSNADLVTQVGLDRAEAEAQLKKAAAAASQAQTAAATLSSENAQLHSEISTETSLVSQLGSQTQAASQEILNADNQDASLVEQITALRIQQIDQTIAEAEAADWTAANFYITNDLGSLPTGITVSSPNGNGQFIWPAVHTVISQGFGPTALTFEPAFNGFPHFHTGVDLAGSMDTPVVAAADGVVVAATPGTTGYGNHIIIDHGNGVLTLYGHLDHLVATVGQTVHQGQLIGLLGSSGNSTGPHLHFEVRVQNQPVDPIPFLPPLPPGAAGP
jgi:murein DD-endopeptidase MepM/ murein hydrolase activator NlpD